MENIATYTNPGKEQWAELTKRPGFDYTSLEDIVSPILQDVKAYGDTAIKKYTLQFDKVTFARLSLLPEEIIGASSLLAEELKNAISIAAANITKFHRAQLEDVNKIETTPGVVCWRKPVGIETVGLYIPGGTAVLFSTLLMLAIPAQIAGCKNIVVCTPAGKDGNVHPAILYTADLLGIGNIFKVGGVQAIAAMAFGSETVPKVDKIFGPGNQYVTAAKQMVNRQGVAIDMPAGPSEVAVYADETCVPAYVAADLLSQAEHGVDSQVILVASSAAIVDSVKEELEMQLEELPRKEIATAALQNSRFVVMSDVDRSFELLNSYAAEHLILASGNAASLAEKVINAGSVFLGNYSPESAGDYASGTNHTLPTNGYATAYSGVSVDSFVKKITFQQLSKEGLKNIGPAIEAMASAEGLEGHRRAVGIRTTPQTPKGGLPPNA
jgi:histidinol dehydrogenase